MTDNDNISTCPFCSHSYSLLDYEGYGACEHLIYVDWHTFYSSPNSRSSHSDGWTHPDLKVAFDVEPDYEDDVDLDSVSEWLIDRAHGYCRVGCRQPTTPVCDVMAVWSEDSEEDVSEWSFETLLALYTADRTALINELLEHGLYREQPSIDEG